MAELIQPLIFVAMIGIFWFFSAVMSDMTFTRKFSGKKTFILSSFYLIDIIAVCAGLTLLEKVIFEQLFPEIAILGQISLYVIYVVTAASGLIINLLILYKDSSSSIFFVSSLYVLVGAILCDLTINVVRNVTDVEIYGTMTYYISLIVMYSICGIVALILAYKIIAPTMNGLIRKLRGNLKQLSILSASGMIIYIVTMLILNLDGDEFFSVSQIHSRISFLALYIAAYIAIVRGINRSVKYLELRDDMRFASDIQFQTLPTQEKLDKIKGVKIYAWMIPYHEVSGDYYDVFRIDENKLGLIIADISGKGLPAAVFMMSTQSMLKTSLQYGKSVSETLNFSNNAIHENNDACIYYTGIIGVLDTDNSKLTYSCAGHVPPIVVRKGNVIILDKGTDPVVGVTKKEFCSYDVQLEKGDVVFLYTDGITDAISEDGERYGNSRLTDIISTESEPAKMIDAVRKDLETFTNNGKFVDDMTMLAFEVL